MFISKSEINFLKKNIFNNDTKTDTKNINFTINIKTTSEPIQTQQRNITSPILIQQRQQHKIF
jgi:hypothetical protein